MCIPSCCKNQELAEIFINYMLSEEPAIANAEYIYYASPNSVVYNNEDYQDEMGEETMEILYMDVENFKELYNQYGFLNQSNDMLTYVSELWHKVRN